MLESSESQCTPFIFIILLLFTNSYYLYVFFIFDLSFLYDWPPAHDSMFFAPNPNGISHPFIELPKTRTWQRSQGMIFLWLRLLNEVNAMYTHPPPRQICRAPPTHRSGRRG